MERSTKNGGIEIYPNFMVGRSKDLMVRGKAFYAIWDSEKNLWSTDEYDVGRLIDEKLWAYRDNLVRTRSPEGAVTVKTMRDYSSGCWNTFKNYIKNVSDNNHTLDESLTFANTNISKENYVSKRLPYPLLESSHQSYDEIVSTLYDPEERAKLEWAIGSIVSGDSRYIQKFIVLYGEAGAGKSTILNIIQSLFDGYYAMFDAKALVGSSNQFSTEVFRSNPLVAIQHDGDLSKIEDNTKLNSIVSHEEMTMNEKFKSSYTARTNCFLFMATNKPVKITDAKSGVIRRLIDVKPSGRKLPPKRYHSLMDQIPFELGGIAYHCLEVYKSMGKSYYSDYRPLDMIYQTDVFFNFVESCFDDFSKSNGVTLSRAYDMYKAYCEDSLVDFKLARHKFREELKNYFEHFDQITRVGDKQIRSYYSGFLSEKFDSLKKSEDSASTDIPKWLNLTESKSIFDSFCSDCQAQYASESEKPLDKWTNVSTSLKDLDTSKLHYVRIPQEHIVIDFDLKDEAGNKCLALNLKAAESWPETYCELSKSGQGLHLHYIYIGDVSRLRCVYSPGIEVKVFSGSSSLRRRLSKCNTYSISTISGGLPEKEMSKTVNHETMKSEKALRDLINRNLRKEIHPGTKPSMDFIKKILDDAYDSGMTYDVSDMESRIFSFACRSTNQSDYCLKLMNDMKFASKDKSTPKEEPEKKIIFFDVEVFPNLFLVVWKYSGEDSSCVRMINPSPDEISELMRNNLIGFNCRRYDNHILYARYLGYSEHDLYNLSQKIISGDSGAMFGEAYNISYTDVYDFSSTKQSLKKFEIELGIHHKELGMPWDQPVPEEKWNLVAEYCDNDVIATEAVFNARQADWVARQILADVAGMTVNDTTNSLSTRIIFGNNRNPQGAFNYRFMGDSSIVTEHIDGYDEYTAFADGKPIFPGYTFDCGKSIYRGEEIGEGGYVYAEPGIYSHVALLDIASMHPSSIIAENLFGDVFTKRFKELLQARLAIKHGDFDSAKNMLDGKLAKYLDDKKLAKQLSKALKIVINSVYGLTSAKFTNAFRDIRNKDNIVAKRGALFMVNLKHEVQKRGFTVAHIKTDSIKIPNATPEIIEFVMQYGRMYGYNFEHEATYERMCLVNDAVYIARFESPDYCMFAYGYSPEECTEMGGNWTATGAEFAQPYLFKKLFSKEPIEFHDMCETKSVSTSMYLDFNEGLDENEHRYTFVGKTGLFAPVVPGVGGAKLLREKDGKYYAVGGTKDNRWMEAEMVEKLGYQEYIDKSYYEKIVEDAISDISKYGDANAFLDVTASDFAYIDKCEDAVPDCGNCPHSGEECSRCVA